MGGTAGSETGRGGGTRALQEMAWRNPSAEDLRRFSAYRDRIVRKYLRDWGTLGVVILVLLLLVGGWRCTLVTTMSTYDIVATVLSVCAAIHMWVGARLELPKPIWTLEAPAMLLLSASISFRCLNTGGYTSPYSAAFIVTWMLGVGLSIVNAGEVFLIYLLGMIGFYAGLLFGGPPSEPSDFFTFFLFASTGVAVAFVSGLRYRDRLRIFLVENQLREHLEEHAKKVDELAVQLQHKVEDRSKALAKALDGVQRRDLEAGHVIDGRVEVIRLLGRGGMGAVYLAEDRLTDRLVAVKLMQLGGSGVSAIRRFLIEAEIVSRVRDPGIVQTVHIDVSEEGQLYQVMEYVEGVSFERHLMLHGKMPAGRAARVGASIARALAAAHEARIVHRDIKPSNVMLTRLDPGIRVLDFGISKLAAEDSHQVTQTHETMGTPTYMSPEQIRRSADVTSATDLYSLGVLLFEALVGRPPFVHDNVGDLFAAHLKEPPPPLDGVPRPLAEIVERCLSKEASARPSALQLYALLTDYAESVGSPPLVEANRDLFDRDETVSRMAPAPEADSLGTGPTHISETNAAIGTGPTAISDSNEAIGTGPTAISDHNEAMGTGPTAISDRNEADSAGQTAIRDRIPR